MGYIAITLPYVVHKNGAHRLPIVSHLLTTQPDQHAVHFCEYACALDMSVKSQVPSSEMLVLLERAFGWGV